MIEVHFTDEDEAEEIIDVTFFGKATTADGWMFVDTETTMIFYPEYRIAKFVMHKPASQRPLVN